MGWNKGDRGSRGDCGRDGIQVMVDEGAMVGGMEQR